MAKLVNKNTRRTGWFYLFAFLIPVLISLCSFAALRIFPFGSESLLRSDANGYYMPFLSYAGSILRGEHGLLYSFSQDIGGGIAATIWPYLVNPFSWIFALFQYEQYPLAYSLGVILFSGLYGLSMYVLYKDMYGNKIEGIILSTCYALCGFNISFVINTAFFGGGPLFLPLAIFGQRKMLRGESPFLYIISIAWSAALQIQMGFAVCMASLLFYFSHAFCIKESLKRTWKRFIFSSIVGGSLSAFVWFPELMILREGRGKIDLGDFTFTSNSPLTWIASRLYTGANSVSQIINGFPAIFCGILPIALAVLFFMDSKTNRRQKISYGLMMVIYLLGFYIRFFTSVFQGMTHANWFNYRFSFVFVFLILLAAADEMERLELLTIKQVSCCGLGVLLFSLFVFSIEYEFIDGGKMVLDLILLAVMGGGFWFHKIKPERASKSSLILLFGVCTCLQLYLNYYFSTKSVFKVWEYKDGEYQEAIVQKEPFISAVHGADDGLYRIEAENTLYNSIGNDGLALGYNGVGYAGHTERGWVGVALERLGIDLNSGTWISYDAGTPAALDSLLGIKYVISDRDLTEEKGYMKKVSILDKSLYENPYALPIAFLSEDSIQSVHIMDEYNSLDNLNKIWSGISGEDLPLFTEETEITFSNHNPSDQIDIRYDEVDRSKNDKAARITREDKTVNQVAAETVDDNMKESGIEDNSLSEEDPYRYSPYIEYRFIAKKTGPIYLIDTSPIVEDYGTSDDVLQYVGWYKEGEEVTGKLYLDYTIDERVMLTTLEGLHICYADTSLLEVYSEKLQKTQVSIQKDNDSQISGEVTAEEGQRLMFTIPYDEGWTLIVDDTEVPLEKTDDLFMSAALEQGTHHYEMVFWPNGLSIGLMLSGCALASLIALCMTMLLKKNSRCVMDTNYSAEIGSDG